jgi:hypothetical protein
MDKALRIVPKCSRKFLKTSNKKLSAMGAKDKNLLSVSDTKKC